MAFELALFWSWQKIVNDDWCAEARTIVYAVHYIANQKHNGIPGFEVLFTCCYS